MNDATSLAPTLWGRRSPHKGTFQGLFGNRVGIEGKSDPSEVKRQLAGIARHVVRLHLEDFCTRSEVHVGESPRLVGDADVRDPPIPSEISEARPQGIFDEHPVRNPQVPARRSGQDSRHIFVCLRRVLCILEVGSQRSVVCILKK